MFSPRRLPLFAFLTAALALTLLTGNASAQAAELDPLVPEDTQSFVSINVRQILDAPVIKKNLLPQLKQSLKDLQEVNAVLEDLGFDPFKDLDRLIVAGPGGAETDRGLIIAYGTFDVAKFTKKGESAARDHEDALKIHKVNLGGGATHVLYEVIIPGKESSSLFVAVVNNKTLIASPGKDYVVDALKAQRAKKKLALKNKEFQTILEKMDPKQSVSVAMVGRPLAAGEDADPIVKLLLEAFKGVEAVGGGLTVNDEVKLDLAVANKDQDSARVVKESLDRALRLGLVAVGLLGESNKQLGLLMDVLKTVKITGKGKVVTVSAKLTADVLKDLFEKD